MIGSLLPAGADLRTADLSACARQFLLGAMDGAQVDALTARLTDAS
jgi:hypothetical protein